MIAPKTIRRFAMALPTLSRAIRQKFQKRIQNE
jgi:hypothetical protein